MPKLEILTEQQRDLLLNWPSPENEDSPWVEMSKPLSECKVALVTTAGLHVEVIIHSPLQKMVEMPPFV